MRTVSLCAFAIFDKFVQMDAVEIFDHYLNSRILFNFSDEEDSTA